MTGLLLCVKAANKTLKAMLSNNRDQAAEVELELEVMRGFLLEEQETDAVRFLVVLQVSETPRPPGIDRDAGFFSLAGRANPPCMLTA